MKREFFIILIALLLAYPIFAQESMFKQGEQLFMENKPEQARIKLEAARIKEPQNEKIYLYLGIVYEQLNKPQEAIKIMRNGLLVATTVKDILYYNIANNYFKQGDNNLASENYTLAITENTMFGDAFLNRAQAYIKLEKYKEAIDDYLTYLQLVPGSAQREPIEKLIALLRADIDEQERQAELQRIQEQELKENIMSILEHASEDTVTESVGAEGYEDVEDIEIDILD
jgi:tetratricopeptide (TPR) repeat protein